MHGAHMVYRKWGYAWCTESGDMHGAQKVGYSGEAVCTGRWALRCDLKESHYACSTMGTWVVF